MTSQGSEKDEYLNNFLPLKPSIIIRQGIEKVRGSDCKSKKKRVN